MCVLSRWIWFRHVWIAFSSADSSPALDQRSQQIRRHPPGLDLTHLPPVVLRPTPYLRRPNLTPNRPSDPSPATAGRLQRVLRQGLLLIGVRSRSRALYRARAPQPTGPADVSTGKTGQ